MSEPCVACGQPIETPYCAHCGEKRASDRLHTIGEFVREHVLEAVASFDGRAIRTFKTLILRPGELTAQWVRGVRLKYVSPLQFFLLLNVAFFLWSNAIRVRIFDTPFEQHIYHTPYAERGREMVRARLEETHEDRKSFVKRFDTIGGALSHSLVLAMIPLLALTLGIVVWDRHPTAVQSLVFSLHSFAFLFLLIPASMYLALGLTMAGLPVQVDTLVPPFIGAGLTAYLIPSLRRVYQFGWLRAAVTTGALLFGMLVILNVYRTLLFFVTFWSM